MRTTRFAAVVTSLLVVAAVGCTDSSLPSAPKRAVAPSATIYTAAASGPTVLSPLVAGHVNNIAWGINDLGDIVGVTGAASSGALWPTGTLASPSGAPTVVVQDAGTEARDVNVLGEVVGSYAAHAAIWTKGISGYERFDLGDQAVGALSSTAYSINAGGQVVGNYTPGNSILRCFLWTPDWPNGTTGTMVDIGDLGGGQCIANDINASGQVTGASQAVLGDPATTHAFVWHGGFIDLGPPGGYSYGVAINDAGQVAGFRYPISGPRNVVVWTPTGSSSWSAQDIVAPPLTGQVGPVESAATDIDDAGFVIGYTHQQSPNVDRTFFWQNGAFTELPIAASIPAAEATAMSNLVGNVVVIAGGAILDLDANTRDALRWAVTVTPVVTEGCLDQLATLVRQMQSAGTLSSGEAKSLLAKVDAATRQAKQGKTVPAKNVLNAFINEVNALVASGRLTQAQAQALIDAALCAIAAL